MRTAGALRASRCPRRQAAGSGRGRPARVVERPLRIDGADTARQTPMTAEARGPRRYDPREHRWAGAARGEQAQQTVHVGAALYEVALVIVRGLRNAGKQHGERQEQDDAAAPSRLPEQPNGERTTERRFPPARDATRDRQWQGEVMTAGNSLENDRQDRLRSATGAVKHRRSRPLSSPRTAGTRRPHFLPLPQGQGSLRPGFIPEVSELIGSR